MTVADPDLQIRGAGGGHSDPEIMGEGGGAGLEKKIRSFGPHFGRKITGGPRPPGPLPLFRHFMNETSFEC